MINIGNNEINSAYIGSTSIKSIYLGSNKLWPIEVQKSYYSLVNNVMYIKLPNSLTTNSTLYFKMKSEYDSTNIFTASSMIITTRKPSAASGGGGHWQLCTNSSTSSMKIMFIGSKVATSSSTQSNVARLNYSASSNSLLSDLHLSEMLINNGTIISVTNSGTFGNTSSTGGAGTVAATTGTVLPYSGYLYFNVGTNTNTIHDPTEYTTSYTLNSAIDAGYVVPNSKTTSTINPIQFEYLMVWKDTSITTVADAIANRATADIDLQYDENLYPINAGTSNTQFIYSTK